MNGDELDREAQLFASSFIDDLLRRKDQVISFENDLVYREIYSIGFKDGYIQAKREIYWKNKNLCESSNLEKTEGTK